MEIINRKPFAQSLAALICLALTPALVLAGTDGGGLTPEQALGKEIFFDKISSPDWMSCASCHAPDTGWTGPIPGTNLHGAVYRGAVPTRFGNRKPPSAAYAAFSPILHFDEAEGLFIGGNFWDGRATGADLGNPAADQARGPFLAPVEQNNPDKQAVCRQIAGAKYASLFEQVWRVPPDCSSGEIDQTYDRIALSIAAYEASAEVSPFSSKYDAYVAGEAELTGQEMRGLALFEGKARCAACHTLEPVAEAGGHALFTDFTFDNLGLPRNPENPFYDMDTEYLDNGLAINPEGESWIDPGLGGFLQRQANPDWAAMATQNMGKHKVPTLRNVAKGPGNGHSKGYGHNGYFKSLKSIVHFYNTRDVKPQCADPWTTEQEALAQDCWPAPEVSANVNHDELGDLGLSDAEEDDVVAFLRTLSDGYSATASDTGR